MKLPGYNPRGLGLVPVPYGSSNQAIQQARAANIDEYMGQFVALLDQAGIPYHVLEQYTPASVGNPVPFYDYIISFPGVAVGGVMVSAFVNGGANDGVAPLQLFKAKFGGYDPAAFASGQATLPRSDAATTPEYGANLPEDYATSFTYGVKVSNGEISRTPNPIDTRALVSDVVLPEGFTRGSAGATGAAGATVVNTTAEKIAATGEPSVVSSVQSIWDKLANAFTSGGEAAPTASASGLSSIPTWAWLVGGAAVLFFMSGRNK